MRFDRKWYTYINVLQGHPSVAHTNKSAELLKNSVEPNLPKGKCLAIGCADGNEVKALNDLGYDTIGITLGQTNIDWAHENLPEIDIRLMEFHNLQFPNDTFDCVYSDNAHEHCFAPMIHCLEVWSVLKNGGKWLIKMPDMIDDVYGGNQLDHHHPNMYPTKYHKKLFEVCGFIAKQIDIKNRNKNDWVLTKDINAPLLHSSVRQALEARKNLQK